MGPQFLIIVIIWGELFLLFCSVALFLAVSRRDRAPSCLTRDEKHDIVPLDEV